MASLLLAVLGFYLNAREQKHTEEKIRAIQSTATEIDTRLRRVSKMELLIQASDLIADQAEWYSTRTFFGGMPVQNQLFDEYMTRGFAFTGKKVELIDQLAALIRTLPEQLSTYAANEFRLSDDQRNRLKEQLQKLSPKIQNIEEIQGESSLAKQARESEQGMQRVKQYFINRKEPKDKLPVEIESDLMAWMKFWNDAEPIYNDNLRELSFTIKAMILVCRQHQPE